MKMRRLAGTAMLAIAALGLGAGTAYADPGPSINKIGYETKLVDKTVITTIDAGMFKIEDDGKTVDLEDSAGSVVITLPLSFTAGPMEFPFIHDVSSDGKTLKLTPDTDATRAKPRIAQVKPVASLLENQRAQQAFATQFGIATAVGGFLGTVVGAVVGFAVGCAAGIVIGCLPVALPFAAVGAIIGTIAIGGPALAIAGFDLIATLNAPPGTTKWNYPTPTE